MYLNQLLPLTKGVFLNMRSKVVPAFLITLRDFEGAVRHALRYIYE